METAREREKVRKSEYTERLERIEYESEPERNR